MPSTIAYSLRLLCIALAFSFSALFAAEPTSPLLGSTRDQVVSKLGEPRSQLAVGNRLVLLYARERVVLRDGVVVDVERVAAEPVRRPAQAPAPAALPAATAAAPSVPAAGTGTDLPPGAVVPAATSTAATAPAAVAVAAAPAAAPVPADAAPVVKVEPTPPPAPEPKLEIKLVRPPSAGVASAPTVRASTKTAAEQATPPPSRTALPSPTPPPPSPAAMPPSSFAMKEAAAAPIPATPVAAATPVQVATEPSAPAKPDPAAEATPEQKTKPEDLEAEEKAKRAAEKAAAVATEKKAKLIKASRRRLEAVVDDATPIPATSGISGRTYVLAFITVAGGAAFLVWRLRQRKLELAATRVSQTPFSGSAPKDEAGGAEFSADFLGKLEWKRFEELVEAYYSKTGVVATRNKGGPACASQVKIAWKGEPRPFALVRCISNPRELIEVKPLQELYTMLAAEDIRRGYVVTTGKFSVPARDYAEEKHLTLLPGEIFLEKLNALPGPARTEIMNAASAGDCSTPSCPTCEARMARSSDVPPVWRCATHPDVTLPT